MTITNPRLASALKMLVLLALALFLYTRIVNGTLLFYINQQFAWLTLVAAIGLLLVAISYQSALRGVNQDGHADEHDDCCHDHCCHEDHDHAHGLSWVGVAIVLAPVLLGVLVPPRPLGVAALATREVDMGAVAGMPAAIRSATEKADVDKNILDWAYEFRSVELAEVVGREADVMGFVYRGEQFGDDAFSLTRYVVSCCVADAVYSGLLVQWPHVAELEDDQWLQVHGRFELTTVDGQSHPILIAESAEPIVQPPQPYLYP